MVGSTVYGFEDQLSQIVAQLQLLEYDVLNSHNGSIKVNPKLSNLENCIKAVEECDLFLGIIRPFYGTGNIGDKNITFEEIKKAIDAFIEEVHRVSEESTGFNPSGSLRSTVSERIEPEVRERLSRWSRGHP